MDLNRLAFLLSLVLTANAEAHGPTPSASDIILSDATGAKLVRLNRGLAINNETGWRFICPSRWGGPASPPVASPDNTVAWIAGRDSLHRVNAAGVVSAGGPTELNSATTRALLPMGGELFGLTGFSGGSTIWRVDPENATPVIESPVSIKALGSDGKHLLVAFLQDNGDVRITRHHRDGAQQGEPWKIAGPLEGTLSLAWSGQQLYIRTLSSTQFRLYEVSQDDKATLLAESDAPIYGPVRTDKGAVVAVDRQLHSLINSHLTLISQAEAIICLRSHAQLGASACVLPNIYPVDTSGLDKAMPRFNLAALQPPDYEGLSESSAIACELDWLDLATDAGLAWTPRIIDEDGAAPEGLDASSLDNERRATTDSEPVGGCTHGPVAPLRVWPACCLLLLLLSYRRRA